MVTYGEISAPSAFNMLYLSTGEAGVPQLEVYMAKDIDRQQVTGKKMSDLQREVIRYID